MWTRGLARLLLTYVVVLAAIRLTVASPEACGPQSSERFDASARAAAEWAVANLKSDDTYVYEARRDGTEIGGYNLVRHAGVTLSLYQAAGHFDDDRYLGAADRALGWLLENLVARDDWRAPATSNTVSLGGASLMAAAIAERRIVTGDTDFDDELVDLGRFIRLLQRDDGGFSTGYYLDRDEVEPVDTSPYFPGEATWALARIANALPDEPGFREAAVEGATFIATERDDLEDVPVPPLNDHWYAYAVAEMASWPVTDDQAAYARLVYGRFHLLIRFEAQREAGTVYAITHGPTRRGAAVGTWVEGNAALWRLARADERLADLRGDIAASAACGAAVLAGRQVSGEGPATDGAWFARSPTPGKAWWKLGPVVTRMDDQQHSLSGLVYTSQILATEHP